MNYSKLFTILFLCITLSSFAQEVKKENINEKEAIINSINGVEGTEATGDKVIFKDGSTILMEIENMDNAGGVILHDVGGVGTGKYLLNSGGNLLWDGNQLGTGSSNVGEIDDLSDGKTNSNSVYLGSGSGSSLTTGTSNTAFGINALQLTDEGSFNTAIGLYSLINNTQGNNNTAVGASSLFFNLIGNYNTALGFNSLFGNTEGNENVAIGYHGLFKNKTGSNNISLGSWSLYNNLIGSNNIAIGRLALEQNTSDDNIAIGVASNYKNTTGSKNIGIGISTNKHNQEGSNNTIIGHEAGSGTVDHNKSGNIFLGYQAGYNETGSNKLYVENSNSSTPLIYGDFTDGSEQVKINGDFHVTGNISVDNDKSISGLDNLIGYNDLKLYGNAGTVDLYISSGGNIGMGENNPAAAKLVVKKGSNVYASKLDGKVIVTDVLEVSGSGIQFNDGDTEDDNIIKKTTKMKYYINVSDGGFPSDVGENTGTLLGEIKLLPYLNLVPGGWLECNGQLVDISTYTSLFSLIGTTYGGNGFSTFALPDMRNAIPNHN